MARESFICCDDDELLEIGTRSSACRSTRLSDRHPQQGNITRCIESFFETPQSLNSNNRPNDSTPSFSNVLLRPDNVIAPESWKGIWAEERKRDWTSFNIARAKKLSDEHHQVEMYRDSPSLPQGRIFLVYLVSCPTRTKGLEWRCQMCFLRQVLLLQERLMELENRLWSLCSVSANKRSSLFAYAFKKSSEICDRVLTFFLPPFHRGVASRKIRLCFNRGEWLSHFIHTDKLHSCLDILVSSAKRGDLDSIVWEASSRNTGFIYCLSNANT